MAEITCCNIDGLLDDKCTYEYEGKFEIDDFEPVFNKMMRLVREQLGIEYDKTRIKGAEFAAQVEANIPAMMQLATKFVIEEALGKAQGEMLYYQSLAAQAQVDLVCLEQKKTAQETLLLCTQEQEASANGVSKRNLDLAQVDLAYTQRAEAVANGISERELRETQNSELSLNGESRRSLEAAQTVTSEKQAALYEAQAVGFENRNRNDTFKSVMQGWAVSTSELDLTGEVPDVYYSGPIDKIIRDALTKGDLIDPPPRQEEEPDEQESK